MCVCVCVCVWTYLVLPRLCDLVHLKHLTRIVLHAREPHERNLPPMFPRQSNRQTCASAFSSRSRRTSGVGERETDLVSLLLNHAEDILRPQGILTRSGLHGDEAVGSELVEVEVGLDGVLQWSSRVGERERQQGRGGKSARPVYPDRDLN